MTFRRLSDPPQPSRILVILDERADSINDPYFAIDMSNTGSIKGLGTLNPFYLIDFPASYHAWAATVSFVDGHAKLHRWREATTAPPDGSASPHRTSGTDRDAAWLQHHSTVPIR